VLLRGGKVSKTHLLHYFRASLANWILDFSDNEEKMTADGKEKKKLALKLVFITSKLVALPISRLHGFNHGDHFGLILFR
jgi:hypothetical protein